MCVSLLIPLSTTDPSIGRVDTNAFSHQTLMELLVDGLTELNKEAICGDPEHPKDISEWKGVTLNENEDVVDINWYACGLRGTVDLKWLPPSVQKASVWRNSFSGTLDLRSLPFPLRDLHLSDNSFTGEIDLTSLPVEMEMLSASYNGFSGSIDLQSLPSSLKKLYLSHNKFSGSVNLTSLPKALKHLTLNSNEFSGMTDFSRIPESLEDLDVSNTKLSGTIHLADGKYFGTNNSNVQTCVG